MKRIIMLLALPLLLCSCGDSTSTVKQINCSEAKELLEEDVALIDVRTKEEFMSGSLKGSVNIPVDVITEEITEEVPDKNTPIIVYCRSGNRSATAAKALIDIGYTEVYDLGAMSNCTK